MIDPDVKLGKDVQIFNPDQVNIFGCTIGDGSFVGPFVEITRDVEIGRFCKIESHAFICSGVVLEDYVFVGHGVKFVNDLYPMTDRQVVHLKTVVRERASLGTNATIIGGVEIGRYAVVGAGAVVTKDVPPYAIVAGNPARVMTQFSDEAELRDYMTSRQSSGESI